METQTQTTRVVGEGTSRITTNHTTIRHWIEMRGGHPAVVKSISRDDQPVRLRIEFLGYRGNEWLEPLSWETFFQHFEDENLALLYQENTSDGIPSRFYRFVNRR